MDPEEPEKNRRANRRRGAKGSVRVQCFANALGLGPNVALALLNVSEVGVRLEVNAPLLQGQEVAIDLCGVGHRRPVKLLANVVWCSPAQNGSYQVGLKFQKYLPYTDLVELAR